MRLFFLVTMVLCVCFLNAQDTELIRISGVVTNTSGKGLEDVQLSNVTQRRFTISNEKGEFYTGVKLGDTLKFSHMGYIEEVITITNDHLIAKRVAVVMETSTEELDEVVVDHQTVDEVTLGIVSAKMEDFTLNERRLKTAASMGSLKQIVDYGGVFIQLEPLMSLLNGRTKELKRNIKLDANKKVLNALYEKFYTYLTLTVKMPEDKVMEFMYYLVDKGEANQLLSMETGLAEIFITDMYAEYTKVLMPQQSEPTKG